MQNANLHIRVNAPTPAEANRLTGDLERFLRGRSPDVELSRVKEDSATQDSGALLIAVLAAPAMVEFMKGPGLELAKGIADWMRKRNASVSIGADGSANVELRPDHVEEVVAELLKAQGRK